MQICQFENLSNSEMMDIDGGIALTTAMLVTLFCVGFAGGIAVGLHKKK